MGIKDSSPSVDYALEVRTLRKSYDQVTAVNDISFNIKKNEIFGLIGPNGAGKTTIIECIEGIRKPDSGNIRLLGYDVADNSLDLKQRIGVQLQKTGFYENLSVIEILRFYGSLYKKSLDPAALLDKLFLGDKKRTLVKNLSGGMYQRLSLAVALINEPDFIFLDEPTTGLDPHTRRMIWDIIKELALNGTTVFLTTHYMEEAGYLCDRVGIMDKGEIIALDTPERLVDEHIGNKTIEIVIDDHDVVDRFDGVERYWVKDNKVILVTGNEMETLRSVLDNGVSDVKIKQGNLEDVFLKLTNRGLC